MDPDMSLDMSMPMSMPMSTSGDMTASSTMMSMPTTTSSGTPASSSSMSMDMDDGGMGMGGCQISMLWNWNTIDSCFISSSWKITSGGMFAGSCIGVILLVMSLEFMRRAVKEYDRYLIKKHAPLATTSNPSAQATSSSGTDNSGDGPPKAPEAQESGPAACIGPSPGYRPTWYEQAVRALLHTVQFAIAYFVMLLAMYYNGYIIICIFIGAYLGSYVFQYETLRTGSRPTSAAGEATVCCG